MVASRYLRLAPEGVGCIGRRTYPAATTETCIRRRFNVTRLEPRAAAPLLEHRMSAALPHRCSLLREGARALELVLTPVEGGHRREVSSHHAVHRLPEGHPLALARNLLDGCEHERRACGQAGCQLARLGQDLGRGHNSID